MSYEARFTVTVESGLELLTEERRHELERAICAFHEYNSEWAESNIAEGFSSFVNWSDCSGDMLELSEEFPELVLELTVEDGEFGYDDFWNAFFQNGKKAEFSAEIVWHKFHPDDLKKRLKIYQIDPELDSNRVMFLGFDALKDVQGTDQVVSGIYRLVYDGSTDAETLEDVFRIFNTEHPKGFRGHSLSVSDVVLLTGPSIGIEGYFYCDTVGFRKVKFCEAAAKPMRRDENDETKDEELLAHYREVVGTTINALIDAGWTACDIQSELGLTYDDFQSYFD